MEAWVIVKMKAFEKPNLSHARTLTMKICPKCRRKHELEHEHYHDHDQDHEHENVRDGSEESSNGSLKELQAPVVAEPAISEVAHPKSTSTATVISSSILV